MTAIQSQRAYVAALRREIRLNAREPKGLLLVVSLRMAQMALLQTRRSRIARLSITAAYRLFSELALGIELRPNTDVGAGLRIFHGTGIVINNNAILGDNVTIRNGVVIGNRGHTPACPVIQSNVEFGAGSMALGGITIGHSAKIGAGAIVLEDIPAFAVAVGNPARILRMPPESSS